MTDPRKAFGQHIRQLRRQRSLTQEQLAERSELSIDAIRKLERGKFSPSLTTLNKLCAGLGLRMSELFASYEAAMDDAGG